jgi:xanthine dehydrogenase accessory factor
MPPNLFEELISADQLGIRCILATVAATRGSVPREPGAKMIVYADRRISGTVGGGKFESLLVDDCLQALEAGIPALKTYILREDHPDSFGAICGGEVTVLIEPQGIRESIFLVGAGHCAQALAHLARQCGFRIAVIEDRDETVNRFESADQKFTDISPADFIAKREWRKNEALVLLNRSYSMDRDALIVALRQPNIGYLGMIGSRRKVQRVFDEIKAIGVDESLFARVHAPIGLDIGADSPEQIAVSVMAEILTVLRGRSGKPMQIDQFGRGSNVINDSTSSRAAKPRTE